MRIRAMTLACAVGLLLGSTQAGAQSYQVLDGNLTDLATGQTRALTGWFDASLSEFSDPSVPPTVLIVDDFAFQAGERSFTPRGPIELDGLTPAPAGGQPHPGRPVLPPARDLRASGDRASSG
jgi:hypothetical protein